MDNRIEEENLPPPPPVPPNVVPEHVKVESNTVSEKPKRVPLSRSSFGSKGAKISLLSNHFRVNLTPSNEYFYHYSVSVLYEDGSPADAKGISRTVIDSVQKTYCAQLNNQRFAYDGEKSLFSIGQLPHSKMEFVVYVDSGSSNRSNSSRNADDEDGNAGDSKRIKKSYSSKTYKVQLNFAAKIPIKALEAALKGNESDNAQEAVRILDVILRQHAAKQGCLIVRQSFFRDQRDRLVDIGGGVSGCRGFHCSFRSTQSGLSLNMDGSTTTLIQAGPVTDFLVFNQGVRHPDNLNWDKAKRTLKNIRIKVMPVNQEYKITGISEAICNNQIFTLKKRVSTDGSESYESVDITVARYFEEYRKIKLEYSGNYPCINVGKPKKPTYIPIELCHVLPLQRYTKALTVLQRSQLVEKSRQKPMDKMRTLSNVMKLNKYNEDPLLKSCGVNISADFTQVEGRILTAPKLKIGNNQDIDPRNGRWNFNQKTFFEPKAISNWAVVNFSARCDINNFSKMFEGIAKDKGISVSAPITYVEEDHRLRNEQPNKRVDKMIETLKSRLNNRPPPAFILCLLPDRKNSELYGPWKKKTIIELGVINQCLSPPAKLNDQFFTNLLLKINAKLGGMNSILVKDPRILPWYLEEPTILFGMDVSHGSPGRSDIPSVAAVVSSRSWPSISNYRASIRAQSSKLEMIDSLFKPRENDDLGIIRELLRDFHSSSRGERPKRIIIFRDGVSESQFNQVLNIELSQIIKACELLDESWSPKFTVIVAQKNHHTKFFAKNSENNVPPGTVIDSGVCHPIYNDFYLCAHAGMIGTTRPTHYHVLHDDIGFSADQVQEMVHSLSYVCQRSSTAISHVAPVRYAHLAASLFSKAMKYDDLPESGSFDSSKSVPVPETPKPHSNVRSTMFFC